MVAYIFLVPTIVSGRITLGIMNQILRAFGQVASSFQFLVSSWTTIIELISIYKRLQAFEAAINDQPLTGIDKEFNRIRMFGKIEKPPFYAIHAGGITVVSPAGLKTNESLNVLDTDGKVIPNLFAAGEVLGFTRLSGSAFVNGMSLMPAIAFGKLLGEKILHWKKN